jgi:myo-inositol-hexaphosphate 3-phosphohydrolase
MSQAGYSQARWRLLVVALAAALLLVAGVLRLFWGPYTLHWPDTQPARPAVTPASDSPASREAANSTTALADKAAQSITARVETAAVPHSGDAADDVAVWVHPTDPSRSTVIATDKKGGLAVYDLAGQQLQYYQGTQPNNVDLRYNFPLAGQRAAIVATSDRSDGTIKIYAVDPATRALRDVAARRIATGIDAYGLCMYRSARTGSYSVFISDEDGTFQQWELFTKAQSDRVDARKVRTLNVGSRSEGCVADDELGALYVAQKEVGLWKYGAEPTAGETRTQVDTTERGSGHLVKDVEGVTLYHRSGGVGYLIVSSQGSNDYAVYERGDENRYLTRFSIASGTVDAVTATDGIDVTSVGLGSAFPDGLFVAQDGSNDSGNQNFKLVPWGVIARSSLSPLAIDTRWDPHAPR